MSNILQFAFRNQDVRVVELNGKGWFVARDVATILGYSNVQDAVRRHCKAAQPVGGAGNAHPSIDPQTTIIPERDVYRLIMRSKLPEAEQFEEWVVGEVLPAINEKGFFSGELDTAIPGLTKALELAAKLSRERDEARSQVAEMTPLVEALERIAGLDDSYCIRDVATTLGIPERKFYLYLQAHNWGYYRFGVRGFIAYGKMVGDGYMVHRQFEYAPGKFSRQARITTKGLTKLAKDLSLQAAAAA